MRTVASLTIVCLIFLFSSELIAQDEFYKRIGWSKKTVSNFHKNDPHEVADIDGMDMHLYDLDYKLRIGYRYEQNIVATVIMTWGRLSKQEFDTILALLNSMLENGGFTFVGREEKSSFSTLDFKNYNRKVTLMLLQDINGRGLGIVASANKR